MLSKGHKVLNLDLIPFPDPSVDVYTLKTDLTDSGQVFNALTSHFNMSGYSSGPVPSAPDVVIHFAGEVSSLLHVCILTMRSLSLKAGWSKADI